jgi:NADPH2:quinone reductase
MRALLSTAPGGPETLAIGELPDPVPAPGEVVIAVAAAGVNFPDTLIIEDLYQLRPPRPFAPGGEAAGTIVAVGEGVSGWKPGDRVMAMTRSGAMAERVAVSQDGLFALPERHGFVEGSALLFTYGTAVHALVDRGHLKAGQTLLVLGAAGGIGIASIEVGKALGARVIAAVSSEEKAEAARAAGADVALIYSHAPLDKAASKALADAFKQACGAGGADVVVDPVGGDYAEPALRAIAWEGRYLVLGFPAGIPAIPFNLPLLKSCDICGVFWGAFAEREPETNRAHIARLLAWWAEGRIGPRIAATYPLERGGEAIAALVARAVIGKVVVTTGN